jgi:hypothetical protein
VQVQEHREGTNDVGEKDKIWAEAMLDYRKLIYVRQVSKK